MQKRVNTTFWFENTKEKSDHALAITFRRAIFISSKGWVIYKTSSNQRLREYVRLVSFYQRANASGSQVVTKEKRAFSFPLYESMGLGKTSSRLHIFLTENCCQSIVIVCVFFPWAYIWQSSLM